MKSEDQEPRFIKYSGLSFGREVCLERATEFYQVMKLRRTVRRFSDRSVDRRLIELAVETAGTAPSGANKQPWRYVIAESPEVRKEIRVAAEKEEKENYESRMPQKWLDDLRKFGTDWHKDFIETAPFLIAVFKIDYERSEGDLKKHYYVNESVGISVGMFLTALHYMGLASLTHTPSPMNFLSKILKRPENEKPFVLIPVGYPAEDATVPDITRKPLKDILLTV